jgi:uncharacterized membrane protein
MQHVLIMSLPIPSSSTIAGALAHAGSGFARILLGTVLGAFVQQGLADPGHGDRGGRGTQAGGMQDLKSFDDRLPWQKRASNRDQENDPDYQPTTLRPGINAEPASKRDVKQEVRPEARFNSAPAVSATGTASGTNRLSEEERRNLRQSIQDAGREVYRPKP